MIRRAQDADFAAICRVNVSAQLVKFLALVELSVNPPKSKHNIDDFVK